jgi:hypothetical protein
MVMAWAQMMRSSTRAREFRLQHWEQEPHHPEIFGLFIIPTAYRVVGRESDLCPHKLLARDLYGPGGLR